MPAKRKRRVDPARLAHRAARREQLLDDVTRVVRTHGPGTSMDVIAAEVGVAKPVLYRYFDHRQGLILALAERFTGSLAIELGAALQRQASPEEVLHTTIDTYIGFVERDPQLYRFLTLWARAEHPQAVTGLQADVARRSGAVLGQRLRELGIDDAPAQAWAFGIVGMVHLAGDWWIEEGGMTRTALVDHLVTLLWSGLRGYAAEQLGAAAQPAGARRARTERS